MVEYEIAMALTKMGLLNVSWRKVGTAFEDFYAEIPIGVSLKELIVLLRQYDFYEIRFDGRDDHEIVMTRTCYTR